ncbi:hypothetical protein [Nocardia terpenica]|uniref:Uncharacterized protein n=1 Tax=Nocardia terpenica TaxID=455432 RepID=A0A6G9Z5C8_9NOCA|nr:hypothetical protein [Nocardia terpenica]QIS20547.1 hypothetical protein F6W96_21865 [Nocardia terpenica]
MSTDATNSTAAGTGTPRSLPPGEYSWQIRHDDRVTEHGVLALGSRHPWTSRAVDSCYDAASTFFVQECGYVVQESRDAILDARVEGRPAPRPPDTVAVILRDHEGAERVSMTGALVHRPVTDADVEEHREFLRACEEEDRRMIAARQQQLAEDPEALPLYFTDLTPDDDGDGYPPEPDVPADPRRQRADDLDYEAAELRDSVVDPEHCRHKLFQAERRLAEAKDQEQRAATADDDALREAAAARVARCAEYVTLWTTRLAESTEIYLRAAAFDAEADRVRRQPAP